jgi:hypothetical protein
MSKKNKKSAKEQVIEQSVENVMPTPEIIEEVVQSEPTISRIRVDVTELNRPIYFIDVTESEVNSHSDIYFSNREQAKRYAQNELLDRKGSISQAEYSEAYWFIENFS